MATHMHAYAYWSLMHAQLYLFVRVLVTSAVDKTDGIGSTVDSAASMSE